jgi:hypothetical protein
MLNTGYLVGFFGAGGLLLLGGIIMVVASALELRKDHPGAVDVEIQGYHTQLGRTGHIILVVVGCALVTGGIVLVILGCLYAAGVIHL